MIRKSTWLALGILIGLIAVVVYLQSRGRNGIPESSAISDTALLMAIDVSDIRKIEIEDQLGKSVRIAKNSSGNWILIDPETKNVDSKTIDSTISKLANLRAISSLENKPDRSEMGLDKPQYIILMETEPAQETFLEIGNATPLGNGTYVLVNGEELHIVNKFEIDTITRIVENPPILMTTEIFLDLTPTLTTGN